MPGDPVVGSTVLRRPAIQSPNFVQSPLTGWAINADGSAFFGNLTLSGTFDGNDWVLNSTGFFFYTGTPAKGNLFMAIAQNSGTDGYGNSYGQGFNIGKWDASTGNQLQHFGLDDNGFVYVVDSAGAIVTYIKSDDGALLGYDTSGQVAGHLSASMAPAAGTDVAGNHYLDGLTAYGSGIATQLAAGSVTLYSGSLAAGWSSTASITLTGSAIILASAGGVITSNNTLDDGSGGATFNGLVTFAAGQNTTTNGLTNGTIAGTSGGASAGTAHTHGPGSFAVNNGTHHHSL
jgi:hypothetical protein